MIGSKLSHTAFWCLILIVLENRPLAGQPYPPLSYDISYFQMFTGGNSIPVAVGNLYYKKLFISARYSYDVQDVFCMNLGYVYRPLKTDVLKIIPTAGILADRMTGYTPGFQINFANKHWVITSINQHMVDLYSHKHLNNIYDWTEINYIIKDYCQPGLVFFEQYFWNTEKTVFSPGVTLFGKVKKFNFFIYAFEPWNAQKDWYLIGFNYFFP